jgi:hypothetical protein
MKLSVEFEVPDEYVEIVMKQGNMTQEQAVEFIRKHIQRVVAISWNIALEGYHLYRAGTISFEQLISEASTVGLKKSLESAKRTLKEVKGKETEKEKEDRSF